ncbi:hypothetical protein BDZ85DRAFT_261914 [Elsinoe ampelina]|uniref:Uncharacterized protein n=1 Tax=Elsinoe ampelina TaxID=302913 RepID=A0A6A6GD78_9PEZI|nr:hypothetical protein BDZ85DRAFT_261914 [Elsinoe ampelina]
MAWSPSRSRGLKSRRRPVDPPPTSPRPQRAPTSWPGTEVALGNRRRRCPTRTPTGASRPATTPLLTPTALLPA